jgi:hypothetical protein
MHQPTIAKKKSPSIPAWDEKALTFRGSTLIPLSLFQ